MSGRTVVPIDKGYNMRSRPSGGTYATTSSIPIQSSDGFGSPRDSAHTPPGVIVKMDTLARTRASIRMSGDKLLCIYCRKRSHCFCKKCTLEKLKFYSRKENISMKLSEKQKLEKEVDQLFSESANLHSNINNTRAHITSLRQAIEEKKKSIELKGLEIARITKESKSAAKYSAAIVEWYDKHDANEKTMLKMVARKEDRVRLISEKLAEVRKNLCLLLFSIFPIREVIAQTVQHNDTEILSDANKRWTVINDHVEEGVIFQVRDMCISEASREKLGSALQASVLNLSSDLRSPFAALLHTVQLINLLTVIFDYRLPYSLSHREMSLCDRWTRELLDTDWFKLCQSVLSLGLHLCMAPEKLYFNYPHSNMIELQARCVLEGVNVSKNIPTLMTSSHRMEMKNASSKLNWEERDLIADWDTCEDVDL